MTKNQPVFEKTKPKWTLIKEYDNPNIDILFNAYQNDHKKAKVIYCQRKNEFAKHRIVLFEWDNGDFRICYIHNRYGISKNNIIYHREKTLSSIRYTNKRFYYQDGYRIKQLTFMELSNFISTHKSYDATIEEIYTYKFLVGRFGWIRNVREMVEYHGFTFNLIQSKKLYTKKAMQRYMYGVPLPVVKILEGNQGTYSSNNFLKVWKEMRKHLINVENITPEFLNSKYLKDTSLMGEALGYKLNCAWGEKRLKLEHDKWAKEVVNIILEFEPLRNLKIGKVFEAFQEFSGYEILRTNHALIEEGKTMGHCVGTYSGAVDTGNSAIYRVEGHTLHLSVCGTYSGNNEKELRISQYRGFSNEDAPSLLRSLVSDKLTEFNKQGISEYLVDGFPVTEDLPF